MVTTPAHFKKIKKIKKIKKTQNTFPQQKGKRASHLMGAKNQYNLEYCKNEKKRNTYSFHFEIQFWKKKSKFSIELFIGSLPPIF